MDMHLINNIPRGFQTNTDAWGRVIFKICVSPNNWMRKGEELLNMCTRAYENETSTKIQIDQKPTSTTRIA